MSINAGFELDGEVVETKLVGDDELFDQDSSLSEGPKLAEDIELITTTFDRLNDLGYLKQDINRAQGMSQTFALEAERLMPGFLNDMRPLGFFTEDPTRTQLQVSLEEIARTEQSLFDKILTVLMQMLERAAAWLTEVLKKQFNEARINEAVSAFKNLQQFITTSRKTQENYTNPKYTIDKIKRLAKDPNSEAFKMYAEALTRELTEGEERLSRFYQTIQSSDELYSLVTGSSTVNMLLLVALRSDVIFESFSKIDSNRLREIFEVTPENVETVKTKAAGMGNEITQISRPYGIESFQSGANGARAYLAQRNEKVDQQSMPLDKVISRMHDTMKKYDIKVLAKKTEKSVEELKTMRMDISRVSLTSKTDLKQRQRLAPVVIDVIRQLNNELTGAVRLVEEAMRVTSSWQYSAIALNRINSDFKLRVAKHLNGVDEPTKKSILEYFDVIAPEVKAV